MKIIDLQNKIEKQYKPNAVVSNDIAFLFENPDKKKSGFTTYYLYVYKKNM